MRLGQSLPQTSDLGNHRLHIRDLPFRNFSIRFALVLRHHFCLLLGSEAVHVGLHILLAQRVTNRLEGGFGRSITRIRPKFLGSRFHVRCGSSGVALNVLLGRRFRHGSQMRRPQAGRIETSHS